MSVDRYTEYIDEVREAISRAEAGADISVSIDDETLAELFDEYADNRIDPEDAVIYVGKKVLRKEGIENPSQYVYRGRGNQPQNNGANPQLPVEDINQSSQWISFKGTVIELYESESDSIAQQGRLADDTGTIRFTIFNGDTDVRLEKGSCYLIEPVVTNLFGGEYEIKVTNEAKATVLEGDDALGIDPETYTEAVTGSIIDFQSQMGLIDRCPNEDCNRVLRQDDYCPDCGDVESVLDLRTKAILDNGRDTWTIFLDEDQTAKLVGIDLEQAKEMAEEYGDQNVARNYIEAQLHGEYLEVHGRDRGRRFDVEELDFIDAPTVGDFDMILEHLEGLTSEQQSETESEAGA